MKKSSAREQKEETVAKLAEKMQTSKSMILADYSGLNVASFQEVKNQLENDEAEFTVAKNTLLSLAAKKAGYDIPSEALKGSTAILFAYGDEILPIKDLKKFERKFDKPTPKIGFLGTELLSAEKITQLGLLPSKEELQAKVVGSIASPIFGIVGVLNGNLRNLVYAVDQIRIKKEG